MSGCIIVRFAYGFAKSDPSETRRCFCLTRRVMNVLVTGGAGYIGSVICDQLLADGHGVVVIDNLSKGHRDALAEEARLVEVDLLDTSAVVDVLKQHRIEAIIHMAAS